MTWQVVFTKQAQKDAKKLAAAGLKGKAIELLEIIREDPFRTSPQFEKLVGDLMGAYAAASIFSIAWSMRSWRKRGSSKSSACGPIMNSPLPYRRGHTRPIPNSLVKPGNADDPKRVHRLEACATRGK